MSNVIIALDPIALDSVTGGTTTTRHYGSGGDPLLSDVSNLASQIKDLTAQTSGFSSTTLMLLMMVGLQRQNNAQSSVVYYSSGYGGYGGRPRWW